MSGTSLEQKQPQPTLEMTPATTVDEYNDDLITEMLSHYNAVRSFLYSRVWDDELASDLTQETFEKAFVKVDTLRDRSIMKSWLFRIAFNTMASYFRSRGSRVGELLSDFSDEELMHTPDAGTWGNLALMENELSAIQVLKDAVGEASYEDLKLETIFRMTEEGYTNTEIAEALHTSVGNVKSRIRRARIAVNKVTSFEELN